MSGSVESIRIAKWVLALRRVAAVILDALTIASFATIVRRSERPVI